MLRRLCILSLLGLGLAWIPVAEAQQFVTQSGGRGLVNAKTNARLTKAEKDIGVLQDEMALVKPHAKVEITECVDTGAKLLWDGTAWRCDSETDPTVQPWAKEALPTCAPGSLLGVAGGQFACNTSGFVSDETDPTVQNFAKAPLPMCGTGQLLGVGSDGSLRCVTDEQGLTNEQDPFTHDFARTDKGAVNNCVMGEVSKMVGGRLTCVVDQVGITQEQDPNVQDFARNDIAGYSLAACGSGEILSSVTEAGKVILKCGSGQDALGEVLDLDDLRDVAITTPTADEVLRYNGTGWVNSNDKIGTLTAGSTCTTNGTEITCTQGAPDVCDNGEVLRWDGSGWSCESAGDALGEGIMLDDLGDVTVTTPVAGHVLAWDGTGWVNIEKRSITHYDSSVLVTDSDPGTGLVQLVPDGVAILTATNGRVGIRTNSPLYDLDVNGNARIATDLFVGDDAIVSGTLRVLDRIYADGGIDISGTVALSDLMAQNATIVSMTAGDASLTNLGVSGLTSLTNAVVNGDLVVRGNLNISGSQTIDGVLFANGGMTAVSVSANEGTIVSLTSQDISVTRNMTVAGGLSAAGIGVTNLAAGQAVINSATIAGNGRVTGDFTVEGNLNVSGSQRISGVLFADGGIQMPGELVANSINVSNGIITSLTSRDVSISNGLGVAGPTSLTDTRMSNGLVTGDFTIYGNLNVSGSQTLGGVMFANGGISATGAITATNFYGDGSGITNLNTGGFDDDRIVSGTSNVSVANDGSVTISTAGNQAVTIGTNGQVLVTDGTAARPAFAFASDTNTGFYSSAADNLGIAAGGTIRLLTGSSGNTLYGTTRIGASDTDLLRYGAGHIKTSGVFSANQMGIGTDVPSTTLHVYGGTPASSLLRVGDTYDRLNVGTSVLLQSYPSSNQAVTIRAINSGGTARNMLRASNASSGEPNLLLTETAGNVGIGTVTPTTKLEVGGEISATNLRLSGNLYVSGSQSIDGVMFANGGVSATGGITATYFTGDGSRITNINTGGFDDDRIVSGTSNVTVAQDRSVTIATAGTARVMVGENGNMGLGTMVPNDKLEIGGNGSLRLSNANTANALDQYIRFINTGNSNGMYLRSMETSMTIGSLGGGYGTIATFLRNSGNVGIGTSTPSNTLTLVRGLNVPNNIELRADNNAAYARLGGLTLNRNYYDPAGEAAAVDFYRSGASFNADIVFRINGTGDGVSATERMRIGATSVTIGRPSQGVGLNVFGNISATDLRLSGNLYVSGSQSIDGVTFANGGVSATGGVTATYFTGDGSRITNINTGGFDDDRIVSGTTNVTASQDRSVTITTNNVARVTVGENGYVGLGTQDPSSRLDLNGGGIELGGIAAGSYQITGVEELVGRDANMIIRPGGAGRSLSLRTYDGSAYQTRLHVTAPSGEVGIGTTAPSSTLHVAGSARASSFYGPVGSFLTTYSDQDITFDLDDDNNNISAFGIRNGTNNTIFRLPETGDGYINHQGSFGIGTVTPTAKLEVAGDISATNVRISGNLYVSGSQTIDGVSFANGGVSATGGVTATYFTGDGSRLTNINTGGFDDDRIVSGTSNVTAANNASVTVATAGSDRFVFGSTGRLGVNTLEPSTTLHVNAGANAGVIIDAGGQRTNLAALSPDLSMQRGLLIVNDGSADTSYALRVRTDTDSTNIRALALTNSGRLGLGTDLPSRTVHIMTEASSDGLLIQRNNTGVGQYASLFFNSSNVAGSKGGIFFERTATNGRGSLHFSTTNDSTPGTYVSPSDARMTIDKDGLVGIGTQLPNAKLDVIGDISATNVRISGNLYVSGSQTIEGVMFANGGVSATGGVTATYFTGDGSRLTNLNTGGFDDDRIVSGTTNVTAANNGSVTVFTNGVERMVVGNSGLTSISGTFRVTRSSGDALDIVTVDNGDSYISTPANGIFLGRYNSSGSTFFEKLGGMHVNSANHSTFSGTGRVGVGMLSRYATPSTTLHVSGTLRIGEGNFACDADRAGAIRYTSASTFDFCDGVTGWRSLQAIAAGSPSDRIVSGTTNMTAANNGSITVVTGGSTLMTLGNSGRIGIGTDTPSSSFHYYASSGARFHNNSFGDTPGLNVIGNSAGNPMITVIARPQNGYRGGIHVAQGGSAGGIFLSPGSNSGEGSLSAGANYHGSNTYNILSSNPAAIEFDNGGIIRFRTASGLTSNTQQNIPARMTILANGNVGISTSSPNAKLDVIGTISATDLRLSGNLYVSGTQSIDGVMFANGGVSATGIVTATSFSGDGSRLTGISGANIAAQGITGSVQFKGVDGQISGTGGLLWQETAQNLKVSGTVQVAGTGAETCGPGSYGQMRYIDVGGGVFKMAMCRP